MDIIVNICNTYEWYRAPIEERLSLSARAFLPDPPARGTAAFRTNDDPLDPLQIFVRNEAKRGGGAA